MCLAQANLLHACHSRSMLTPAKTIIIATTLIALSACGGGGGDTQALQATTHEASKQPGLDHLSAVQLQRAAASGAAKMRSGLDNMQHLAQSSDVGGSLIEQDFTAMLSRLLGMSGGASISDSSSSLVSSDNNSAVVVGDTAYSTFDEPRVYADNQTDTMLVDDNQQDGVWHSLSTDELIDITVGLLGDADITRDGDSVFINPDDRALCEHEFLAGGSDALEMLFCLAMVTDLRVRIDGQTQSAGSISYLFQDASMLSIDYAPSEALYKVYLGGLHKVMQRANAMAPLEFETAPETFEGIVALDVKVKSEKLGAEAGSINLAVTSPIAIDDQANGAGLKLAASNLIRIESDHALGTSTIEMDVGAASYYFTDDHLVELKSTGSSVKIDLVDDGNRISVTKLGLGISPLTVSIDSVEVVRVSLENAGFDIDTISEKIQLTSELDFNVVISLVSEYFGFETGGLDMRLSVKAPLNSTFSGTSDGDIKLDNAGPFSLDWFSSFNGQTHQSTFVAQQGECFTEAIDGNALFSLVVCQ